MIFFLNSNYPSLQPATTKIFTVLISDGGSLNPTTIIIRKYQYGDSVCKFVNLCQNLTIEVKERNGVEKPFRQKLLPYESFFFVWPEFQKSSRELVWNAETCQNSKDIEFKTLLTKSGSQDYRLVVDSAASVLRDSFDSELTGTEDHARMLIGREQDANKAAKVEVKVSCVSYIDGNVKFMTCGFWRIERRRLTSCIWTLFV